ncbi:MAG: PAS domain S-box protein [Acidobacteria bacterium]|nr:PAS domain S-box protein [Acidobacteriota bacterium]
MRVANTTTHAPEMVRFEDRHWIEIFDAISDFLLIHDDEDKVLHVNRALANSIGVDPAQLRGIGVNALLATGTELPPPCCPLCRTSSQPDEFVENILDRTYLISTSRIHGTREDGDEIIHVLKDITDRQEAERRYRELLDNIQEGLFFTSPDGRFIDVNEALVRILGYDSREELLDADIPDRLYSSRERR